MEFYIVEEVLLSKTWKSKTVGFGEHDFMFNVPPPTGKALAHADGPKKITPDLLVYGFKLPTAQNVRTDWEDKWFSRMQRISGFLYTWTEYKSDPPPLNC